MSSLDRPSDPQTLATRASLLSRLRDLEDRKSWEDFFATYWKLIYSVARKAGLNEEEAKEVVQETTISVSKYIQEFRYDPKVCSFKTWLLQKTRWKIIDQVRKRPPRFVERFHNSTDTGGTSPIERIPDPQSAEMDAVWDEEWHKNLLDAAMERVKHRVKGEHYQIFFLSMVRKLRPRKVAQIMGVNIAQVYLVRHRVGALIKQEIASLERP